ncbi:unannotated protein [freshwater metagenome]|uniref:Unannotated protein n=1 Tax=freshwater metagenome TaxID=449393 RepID=A0A6J6RLK4_9ZZZZ
MTSGDLRRQVDPRGGDRAAVDQRARAGHTACRPGDESVLTQLQDAGPTENDFCAVHFLGKREGAPGEDDLRPLAADADQRLRGVEGLGEIEHRSGRIARVHGQGAPADLDPDVRGACTLGERHPDGRRDTWSERAWRLGHCERTARHPHHSGDGPCGRLGPMGGSRQERPNRGHEISSRLHGRGATGDLEHERMSGADIDARVDDSGLVLASRDRSTGRAERRASADQHGPAVDRQRTHLQHAGG